MNIIFTGHMTEVICIRVRSTLIGDVIRIFREM